MENKTLSKYHNVNHNIMYGNLQDTKKFCEELNIRYCLLWGTMLGAVRDQNIIEHDYDLDIGLVDATREQLNALQAKFRDKNYQIMYDMANPFVVWRHYEWIDFDLFGLKDNYYYFKHMPFHKKFFEKFDIGKINYEEYPIPHNAVELIEIIYGDSWPTPMKWNSRKEYRLGFNMRQGDVLKILADRKEKGI